MCSCLTLEDLTARHAATCTSPVDARARQNETNIHSDGPRYFGGDERGLESVMAWTLPGTADQVMKGEWQRKGEEWAESKVDSGLGR